MKRLLLIFAILLPVALSAGDRASRIAKKYDFLKDLPSACDRNPSTFWNAVIKNNKTFYKEIKDFKDPSDPEKQAMRIVEGIRSRASQFHRPVDNEYEDSMNNYLHDVLVGSSCIDDKLQFRYVHDNTPNAGTDPDGFVFINTGLIDRLHRNDDLICAVVAHEIAHYIFKHHLIQERNTIVTDNINKVFAGIGSGLYAGAVSLAESNAKLYGGSASPYQSVESFSEEMRRYADDNTKMFYYRFGREQESMADIAAYRLLEWIGRDPSVLIDALYYISPDKGDSYYESNSTHPSTLDRIRVLSSLSPAKFRVKK